MLDPINNQSMLKVGTILHGTYRIDSYLSSGGFGNTYVATNIEFDERVAIKEFFMKGVTQRDDNQTTVSVSNAENNNSFLEQKEKFKKEARRLRKMQNEHLVRVHDLFDENGTTYYVMDYVDGENLSERLKRTGRPMTESEVRLILPQILDALKAVHNEGFCHLDIKPSNIMLEKGGKIKLIDFGASKQLGANGTLTTNAPTAFAQTPGYAPREQTEQNLNKIGPWTDIYALGATLYNLLTNKKPPLPTDIDDDISDDKHDSLLLPANLSSDMRDCILWMMQTNRMKRPQSVESLSTHIVTNKEDIVICNSIKYSFEVKDNKNFSHEEDEDTILESVSQNTVNKEESRQVQLKDETSVKEIEVKKSNNLWIYIAAIAVIACICTYLYNKPNYEEEYSSVYKIFRASNSTKEEKEQSIKKFSELAEKKYGPAIYMLGIVSKDSIEAEKYYTESMKYLPQEAESGDMYAQCCLGEYIIQDSLKAKEAFSWFMKAAENGLTIAMTNVGDCFITGTGVEADNKKALLWYEKASQSGDDQAQRNLGYFYESGMLDIVDSTKAYKWFEQSAKQGNANSMAHLGIYYREGSVVKKDMLKALSWFTKAAEKGDYEGNFNVGLFYRFGRDPFEVVDKSLPEAIKYFNRALECETPYDYLGVHGWLAYCYQETKDYKKMFEHFKIAAENNIAEAQYEVSRCYKNGLGVEANQKLSQMWRKRAIENGYEE